MSSILKEFIRLRLSLGEALLAEYNVLLEGIIDDIKARSDRAADEWDDAFQALQQSVKKQTISTYLRWLEKVAQPSQEPMRDIIPLISAFDKLKNSGRLHGSDADINRYKSVADLNKKLETLPRKSGRERKVSIHDSRADTIYESDNFLVVVPYNEEASCFYGKNTSWCTARTKSENLFYHYVLEGAILFYVIDKNDPSRRWSIGVQDGNIEGIAPGGLTVDAKNNEFTHEEMKQVFQDEYKTILHTIKTASAKYHDKHPALHEIEAATKSVGKFKDIIKGMRPENLVNFLDDVQKKFGLEDEVKKEMNKVLLDIMSKDDYLYDHISTTLLSDTDILDKLANNEDPGTRQNVALNPNTSSKTLVKLVDDENDWIRVRVADNPNTPSEALAKLADDENKDVRWGVAHHPNTPPDILVKLADDENASVRMRVAENPNTPSEALSKLATDEYYRVPVKVAPNPNTPIDTLKNLSFHKDEYVRRGVAINPNTPPEILSRLINDRSPYVSGAARRNS